MKYLGAAGVAGLAGCSGDGDDGTGNNTTTGGGGTGTGNGTQTTQQNRAIGGTYKWGTQSGSRNGLSILSSDDGETDNRIIPVFDYPIVYEDEETIEPRLYKNWELSDSNDVVTAELWDNLSYGEPWGQVTADDFITWFHEIGQSPWSTWTYKYRFQDAAGEDFNITKDGKLGIRVEFNGPRPLAFHESGIKYTRPIPKEIVNEYAQDEDFEGLKNDSRVVECEFSGNLGGYNLVQREPQSVCIYERNPDYYLREHAEESDQIPDAYAEAPYFDEQHIQVFDSSTTMRSALRSGGIDYTSIPATKREQFVNDPNITVVENPYIGYSDYLGINQRANAWSELRKKEIRWAISNLFNRQFVVENILGGKADPQGTLHPGFGPYYPEDVKTYEWTVEKAKQLIRDNTSSEYGYDGNQLMGEDGQVTLTLPYVSSTLDDQRAQYAQKRLGQAGFQVDLQTTSWSSLLQQWFAPRQPAEGYTKENWGHEQEDGSREVGPYYNPGPWDRAVSGKDWDLMLTLGFSYGPWDPAGTIRSLFSEQGSFNAYGYTAEGADIREMSLNAKTADSLEEAQSITQEMLKIIGDQAAVCFESNYYSYTGWWHTMKGLPQDPLPSYWTSFETDLMFKNTGGQ